MEAKKVLAFFALTVSIVGGLASASYISGMGMASLISEVHTIMIQDQMIRGLKFKQQPHVVVLTKAEAMQKFKPSKPDIKALEMKGMVYKMTLLLPPNYSMVHATESQEAEWVAVTVGNTIYIIKQNFDENRATAERTIAHELVHVLQRQWFNAPYGGPTLDSTLAIRALVEGDADLVADMFCNYNHIPIHKIRNLYTRNPMTDIGIFPYVFGDPFVRYLYKVGGWKLVNSAYRNLPVSTKQVMFPELYIQGWKPLNVTASLPSNYEVIRKDRMGAFYVFLLYWGHGANYSTAMSFARAWVGDRLVFGTNGTAYMLVWNVEFNSSVFASKFATHLRGLASGDPYARFRIYTRGNIVTLVAVRKIE